MITQKTKDKYVALAHEHREMDRIIQGIYWEFDKGCAVGCMVKTGFKPHRKLAELTGVPECFFFLQDRIFEGLSVEDSKTFVVDFWEALPVDTDLEPIKYRFLSWLQSENLELVEGLEGLDAEIKTQVIDAIKGVKAWLGNPTAAAASSAARSAAYAASSAAYAARSTASSAAYAARSAARSAAYAAEAAAWAAADAASSAADAASSAAYAAGSDDWSAASSAAWAAEAAAWAAQCDKLLELLRGTDEN